MITRSLQEDCMQDCASWMRRERRSFSVPFPKTRDSVRQCETGCSELPGNASGFRSFVQVLNTVFINQRARRAMPDFNHVQVIPLDNSSNALAIFELKDHRCLALNLFLQIIRF